MQCYANLQKNYNYVVLDNLLSEIFQQIMFKGVDPRKVYIAAFASPQNYLNKRWEERIRMAKNGNSNVSKRFAPPFSRSVTV